MYGTYFFSPFKQYIITQKKKTLKRTHVSTKIDTDRK